MTGISEQEMEEAWRFDQEMHEAQRRAFCDYEEANRRLAELMRSFFYTLDKAAEIEAKISPLSKSVPNLKEAKKKAMLEQVISCFKNKSKEAKEIISQAQEIIEQEK